MAGPPQLLSWGRARQPRIGALALHAHTAGTMGLSGSLLPLCPPSLQYNSINRPDRFPNSQDRTIQMNSCVVTREEDDELCSLLVTLHAPVALSASFARRFTLWASWTPLYLFDSREASTSQEDSLITNCTGFGFSEQTSTSSYGREIIIIIRQNLSWKLDTFFKVFFLILQYFIF